MKIQKYLKNVTTLKLNQELCIGCKMCINVCPREVFSLSENKAVILNKDFCIECGACAINCPSSAISVKSGVGCAAGIINGILTGNEPTCGCGDKNSKSSCC